MTTSTDKRTVTSDAGVPEGQPETTKESVNSGQPKEHGRSAQVESDQHVATQEERGGFENSAEPTRYGDWEIAGRCIDF